MMNLKQFSMRLELGFWNLAINLLSESTFLQKIVAWFYHHAPSRRRNLPRSFNPVTALACGGAGLLLGFIGGFLAGLPLF